MTEEMTSNHKYVSKDVWWDIVNKPHDKITIELVVDKVEVDRAGRLDFEL